MIQLNSNFSLQNQLNVAILNALKVGQYSFILSYLIFSHLILSDLINLPFLITSPSSYQFLLFSFTLYFFCTSSSLPSIILPCLSLLLRSTLFLLYRNQLYRTQQDHIILQMKNNLFHQLYRLVLHKNINKLNLLVNNLLCVYHHFFLPQ